MIRLRGNTILAFLTLGLWLNMTTTAKVLVLMAVTGLCVIAYRKAFT